MSDIEIRPARADDAPSMCALLNAIIEKGGTTAHATPFDERRMLDHYIAPRNGVSCLVAEGSGTILGFQSLVWAIGYNDLPDGWAVIASFVDGHTRGKGVGRKLFACTLDRAREAGVRTIDAAIREDNALGRAFYEGLGFVRYGARDGVTLSDGTMATQVLTRYDIN